MTGTINFATNMPNTQIESNQTADLRATKEDDFLYWNDRKVRSSSDNRYKQ